MAANSFNLEDLVRFKLKDVVRKPNFKNPQTSVLTFTVQIFVGSTLLIEMSNVGLFEGRIQIPERKIRTPEGELRTKVVRPLHVLLNGIRNAIFESGCLDKYPDVATPLPLVNREFMSDINDDDPEPPAGGRYRSK